jgi:hypothetical protein
MGSIWSNLGRSILLILFLPLLIFFGGPLLLLAAMRGEQPLGPLTLNTSQYGPTGRLGTFMLGLALWLLIWGGLFGLGLSYSPAATVMPAPTLNLVVPIEVVGPTTSASPTPTATATATRVFTTSVLANAPIVGSTAVLTLSATAPAPVDEAEAISPSITITTTATLAPTAAPTLSPVASPQSGPVEATESEIPTSMNLTEEEQQTLLATVTEGNQALREAIILNNEETKENLQTIWRGRAYDKAESFALEHYERYAKPLKVEFEYLTPPTISNQSTANQIIIFSQEIWTYGEAAGAYHEAFEFIYTLTPEDGKWIISNYTYRNLPSAPPTVSPSE